MFDGTVTEWVYAYAACMEEGGFAVTVDEKARNFDSVDLPPEQYEAWNARMESCGQEVGDPRHVELTEAQVRDLFDANVAIVGCLEQLGFEISDPPSRESWVKAYSSGPIWLPHAEVGRAVDSAVEWEKVEEECPQPEGELPGES